MRLTRRGLLPIAACLSASLLLLALRGGEPPRTGPETEKRFPPLQVPPGFKATLFACDPLIEYPSVIAAGPRPGALFVAIDYMTGLGVDIVRRDEIRLVEDTDGDGYADKATVFAKGFNSIQGLAYHDGTVYVMHAPHLTALRDTKGTGVADERRDLLTGLGLTPEQNPTRLHCANGVVVGHDGWLYLAMGDNGVDVLRPEGDRLLLQGGGILRCRSDGRDLHVFATGLRNIYDVALDAELNVFVRDNENDGGTYMIRVCHSFHGADHGYPYLCADHPDEALAPLADLGLGSSAGGVCYLEQQFPPENRGDLFFCEWGRAVVRYQPRHAGSSFAPLKEITFVSGAPNDPYGFRPTDIVVQRDGAMMVSDWADGQRPKRGRGRIYRITHGEGQHPPVVKGDTMERWLALLASDSYYTRCDAQAALERRGRDAREALTTALAKHQLGTRARLHAIWVLARLGGPMAIEVLLPIARIDAEPAVRAQAVRAIADLVDPVLTRHKLDAGAGDADRARQLAALASGQDPSVLREIVIALGRLRWTGIPEWLQQNLVRPDAALAHAATQALRRCQNWPAILKLVDLPESEPVRAIALRALAERYEPVIVDAVTERLGTEKAAARRLAYADLLTRVYKRPGPWKYWGYRPAPRPANAVAWERTEAIAQALERTLADPNRAVRLAILRRMEREKVPVRAAVLATWLIDEQDAERAAAILSALRDQTSSDSRKYVEPVVRDTRHTTANRLAALAILLQGFGADADRLLALVRELEDGPVLAEALRRTTSYPKLDATAELLNHVKSREAEVRAAAIEALGERRCAEVRTSLLPLLRDSDVRVRRAAAGAAGKLGAMDAVEPLVKLVADTDPAVRRASLESLRQLRAPQAVPLALAALADRNLELTALESLGELAGPEHAATIADFAQRSPSAEVPASAVRILTAWRDRQDATAADRRALDSAVAGIHGASGIVVRWQALGPTTAPAVDQLIAKAAAPGSLDPQSWRTWFATGTEARVKLAKDGLWLAAADMSVADVTPIEFLVSSSGSLRVWLNGKELHRRDQSRTFQLDSDRFPGTLAKGTNRVLVVTGQGKTGVEFHLRFRRKSSNADHERLTQAALTRPGNPDRGKQVFLNVEKSQCLKCHRLGEEGEHIGPELTGIGSRFSRIYLVESVLQPSRTIAPSYGTFVATLQSGKLLSGVKIAETDTTVTLADNQGQKHMLVKRDIETLQASSVSVMPEGLEKRLTEDEFVDLIGFLANQKSSR
jgi:putative membrane-bound dehydrogenase-like protein